MSVQIYIDSYNCNSCGSCVALAPETFRFNDFSEKAELFGDQQPDQDTLAQVVAFCPTHCIELVNIKD